MEAVSNRSYLTTAYQLARQTLLANPRNVAAWLQLSTLVDDSEQQQECLRRALALDPHNEIARERLEHLRVRSLLVAHTVGAHPPSPSRPQMLGEYLVAHGFITKIQLQDALREQRLRQQHGVRIALGELLLNRGWLSPALLARALAYQPRPLESNLYLRLGEYLVSDGLITRHQLEAALAEQLLLKQRGEQVRLGEVLLRMNVVTKNDLERILERQQAEYVSCFGD
jgi:hypothetical protein